MSRWRCRGKGQRRQRKVGEEWGGVRIVWEERPWRVSQRKCCLSFLLQEQPVRGLMEVCPSLGGLLDGPPCTLGTVCPECGFVGTSQVQSQLPTSAFNATGTLPVLGVSTTCRREATFLQVTAGLGSDSELPSFVSYHHPQRWICTISDICIIPRAASFAPKVSSASSW